MDDALVQDLPDCGDTVASVTIPVGDQETDLSALTSLSQEQERRLAEADREKEESQRRIQEADRENEESKRRIQALEARLAELGGGVTLPVVAPAGGTAATHDP